MQIRIVFILLMTPLALCSQILEAESTPRPFHIDQSQEIDDESAAYTFDIQPYRIRIRTELEKQARNWFQQEGKQLAHDNDFEERFVKVLENTQPIVIQTIGTKELSKGKPECFIREKTLDLDVVFPGFRPARFSLPLKELESFLSNIQRINFTEAKVAFDDEDYFVLTHLKAFNPDNQRTYVFESPLPPWFKSPSFNISIPSIEE